MRLKDRSLDAGRYFLVRYRSDFHDISRDRANSAALAELVCHAADSAGVNQILIRPTRTSFGGFVSTSLKFAFTVDSARRCTEGAK